MSEILISSAPTSLEDLVAIARQGARVRLTEDSRKRVAKARHLIEQWVREGRTIYGVTTGFGALSDVAISKADTRQLQENVLLSHAAGIGRIIDKAATRAVMGLRIKDFARGYSGVRLQTLDHLVELLNRGVHPVMPEKGSVGASGSSIPN